MKRLSLLAVGLTVTACSPRVDPATLLRARGDAARVDQARLLHDVELLSAAHLSDTPFDCSTLNVRETSIWCSLSNTQARRFVTERLESLGLEVREDIFDGHPPTHNLVADVVGTTRPDDLILVGAHYDAFFAGADDNGSGVAVVLELARLVAERPLARTVRFVGFDLEEYGLVGSTRLVQGGTHPLVTLVFDGVGYRDRTPGSQASLPGFPVPPAGDFVAAIGNDVSRERIEQVMAVAQGIDGAPPVQAIIAPGLGAGPLSGNLMRSDHAPFWLAGDSAVFFTDTANFRNPNYHEDTDTPATLDPEFLAEVARLAMASVVAWGDAP